MHDHSDKTRQELLEEIQDLRTRAREAEERLDRVDSFRQVLDQGGFMQWEWDEGRAIRFMDPELSALLARPVEDLVGSSLLSLLSEAEAQRFSDVLERLYGHGRPFRGLTLELPSPAGPPIILDNWGTPIRDAEGCFLGYRVVSRDISKRRVIEHSMVRQVQELNALHRLSREITAELSLEPFIRNVLQALLLTTHADIALLFLLEGDDMVLLGQRTSHALSDWTFQEGLSHEDCLCGRAGFSGDTLFCTDISRDDRCTLAPCREAGIRSFAALPLIFGRRRIGVLALGKRAAGAWEEQERFLESIATIVSTGLNNVLLHEELTDRAEQLESSLAEVRRSREDLLHSRARFRDMFHNHSSGVAVFQSPDQGEHFQLVDLNPAGMRITGLTVEEARGRDLSDLYPIMAENGVVGLLRTVFLMGEDRLIPSVVYDGRDGQRWFSLHIYRLPEDEIVVMFTDVTAQKQAEDVLKRSRRELELLVEARTEELQVANRALENEVRERARAADVLAQSEKKYRLLFEQATDAIFIVDAEKAVILDVNYQAEKTLGYTRQELLDKSIWEIDEPGMEENILASLRELRENGSARFETRHVRKDGSVIDVEIKSQETEYDGGPAWQSLVRDVSERKAAEKEMRRQRENEHAFASLSALLLTAPDMETIAMQVLETAKSITGSRYGYVGTVDQETGHLLCHTLTRDIWDQCDVADKSPVFEHYKGLWGWSLEQRAPIVSNDPQSDFRSTGTPKGHIPVERFLAVPAIIDDRVVGQISLANADTDYDQHHLFLVRRLATLFALALQRHTFENGIVAARDEAEKANRAKSDFLAKMSHEIRTPMNAILGMADIVRHSNLTEPQQGYMETIDRSARHLLALINDILDISRIEARMLEQHEVDFDLHGLFQALCDTLEPMANAKGLNLELAMADDVPRWVRGDPDRLRQVCTNIAGNAVKFTEMGTIRIYVACLAASGPADGRFRLACEISDTGAGIDPDALDNIFIPFFQAQTGLASRQEGTGLGLAITRELLVMMGGDISVESTPGVGSTFRFDLELRSGKSPEKAAGPVSHENPVQDNARPLRILLAEDNEANVRVATVFLKRLGHEIEHAPNGREALELLRREPYDLVLMDLEMPIMDGLEASRRIRGGEAGADRADVPIVALTAHAVRGFREKCMEAGMNDYIAKPFSFQDVAERLQAASGRAKPDPVAESAEESQPGADRPQSEEPPRLDFRQVLANLNNDQSLLRELIAIFLRGAPAMRTAIEEGIRRREGGDAQRMAHTLKGNALTIGAEDLGGKARAMHEALIRRDWDEAQKLLPGLLHEWERVLAVLEAMRESE